ncbi:hypothetical protein EON63_16555 [archaeon]|nr:MAG: hypothetical protein EON63_16555 [archaeon]
MSREFLSEDVYAGLSAETIKALREFALEKGVNIIGDDPDAADTKVWQGCMGMGVHLGIWIWLSLCVWVCMCICELCAVSV